MSWTVANMLSLAGKRFFITGANSGIGYAAAAELARRGGAVVIACRDRARGEAALARLKQEISGPQSAAANVELVQLDLASLVSVHAAAEAELARNLPLDCLINNAGVMAPPRRRETADGLELQFGTNVVGHFTLTGLLLPALERASAARVVTVASIAHKRGKLNFDDLQSLSGYSPMGAYQQSKLGDLVFALELERRLRAADAKTISVAVHPGIAQSSLFKVGSSKGLAGMVERALPAIFGGIFNSSQEGALPTLYGATAQEPVGGGYFGSQSLFETRGGDVGPAQIARQALDMETHRRLWAACEELSGMRFLEPAVSVGRD